MLYVWVLILTSMTGTAHSGVVGNRAMIEEGGGGGGGGSRGLEDTELSRIILQESRLSAAASNSATLHARRITPKSVFIAPNFGCASGKWSNGQCLPIIKVNQSAQWDFLLQSFNNKFAVPLPSSSSSGKGPVRVSIPLGVDESDRPRMPESASRLQETPSTAKTTTAKTTTAKTTTEKTTTEKTTTETTATTFRDEEPTVTTLQTTTTLPLTTTVLPPETTTELPPTTTFPTTTTVGAVPASGSGSGCPEDGDVEVRQVRAERTAAAREQRPCPHRHHQQPRRTVVIFEDDRDENEDGDPSESIGLRRVMDEEEHRVIHRSGSQGFVRWPDDDRPQPYWWPTSYQRIRHYHWNHHHLHGRSL